MSLLPFLIVTLGGAGAAFLLRSAPRVVAMVGTASLGLAFLCALAIRPDQLLVIGDSGIATTGFLRLFLLLGTVVGALLALVGGAAGGSPMVLPTTLGILGTSALALALPDPRLAVIAATAGGTFGAFLCIGQLADRVGATIGVRVLRATIIAGAMAISAAAWIGRDLSELAARPVVFGLAYLAMALAVAIRFGAIPVHAWAARLAHAINETELPLVTAWAPAALAVVVLAWADTSIAPLLVDLDTVRVVVVAIALASIVLASVAAWIQDDIEHIVGYSIIGDAGVVILAIAALDPEVWAPARTWILAFVVTRSAFAAWAGATRATFGTGRLARPPRLGDPFAAARHRLRHRRRGRHRLARPGRVPGPRDDHRRGPRRWSAGHRRLDRRPVPARLLRATRRHRAGSGTGRRRDSRRLAAAPAATRSQPDAGVAGDDLVGRSGVRGLVDGAGAGRAGPGRQRRDARRPGGGRRPAAVAGGRR